jgi:hypothetical protein
MSHGLCQSEVSKKWRMESRESPLFPLEYQGVGNPASRSDEPSAMAARITSRSTQELAEYPPKPGNRSEARISCRSHPNTPARAGQAIER